MTYRDELRRQCETLSSEELFTVVNNRGMYNDLIVATAYLELRNRRLPKEEIKKYKEEQNRRAKIITGNIVDDLSLIDKLLFFFLFPPQFNYFVRRSYRKQNYVLKLRQAGYYTLLGFAFFILTIFLGHNRISLMSGIIIWVLSFLPAYAFDRLFYKQRTVRRLSMRVANPEVNEGN